MSRRIQIYAPLFLAWVVLVWLHRPGWLESQVFWVEDVVAVFYAAKTRTYLLAQGLEPWSWWDPLAQLGIPRLSNVQVGWFSPFSLWFAALPPVQAWRLYPLFIDSVLLLSCYAFLRSCKLRPLSASWGALMWVGTGSLIVLSQDPCYKESMVATCLTLASQIAYWRTSNRRYLLAVAASGALHAAAGSPTGLFYNHLCLLLLLPALAFKFKVSPRRVLCTGVAYTAGLLLLFAPWLALQDFIRHGHRQLAEVQTTHLFENYRRTPIEIVLPLASETLLGQRRAKIHSPGYYLVADFSIVVSILALGSWRDPRLRPVLFVTFLLMLQMLGERGGGLWLLHKLLPATQKVRAPERFFLAASLGWIYLAASTLDIWLKSRLKLASSLVIWSLCFVLLSQTAPTWAMYVPAVVTAAPPPPPTRGGRVTVSGIARPRPPVSWETITMTMGLPTLVIPEALFEQHYLLGLAHSQWGARGDEFLSRAAQTSSTVPLLRPQVPLMQSWGLTWLLDGDGTNYVWRRLQPDPKFFWMARPIVASPKQWAQSENWKPFEEAQVDSPIDVGPDFRPGRVVVEFHEADYQRVRTRGAGLLVASSQWDPGWKCKIDGQPVPVIKANFALRSCFVSGGEHVVEWQYEIPWLTEALFFHVLGWALLAASCFLPAFHRHDPQL